ncbi:MAG: carbohydrate porin [Rhabdochlamydiaceae bacterium]|nr:carbohydrate porin [Rhabdochlamydiaceae bacterium]
MNLVRQLVLYCLFVGTTFLYAKESSYGISGNPGAVNILTGTGELGKLLQIPESSGVRLGGVWLGDYNALLCGGDGTHHNRRWTGNSSFILDLSVDLQKAMGWKNAFFGTEFLQFNGQPTNGDAGVVQGYNSLPGSPPLNRSELYQLWLRQTFLDDKLSIRIGKTVPIYHFNNVSKPVPKDDPTAAIPSVTGLIYTPIFVNTTLIGAIGGYYNSVYGIVATISPSKEAYVNLGFFDGNLARGVQTGLMGPHFNGYYFSITEAGYGWTGPKPGIAAIGGWYQSGLLKSGTQKQNGTGGIYGFGSQALWTKESQPTNKNISGFFQFGWNNSRTLPMNLFAGMGLTAFALVHKRPNDSFGFGVAWSRLNRHTFERYSEFMFQTYYQAQLYSSIYFQPVLSYIPNPGAHPTKSNVVALTGRLIVLF